MSKTSSGILSIVALIFVFAFPCLGQVQTGSPPLGSFSGGPDVINLANLNVHLNIPIVNKPGRGIPFVYNLMYDSSVWSPAGGSWNPAPNFGFSVQTTTVSGGPSYSVSVTYCYSPPHHLESGTRTVFSNFTFRDPFLGAVHSFAGTVVMEDGTCGSESTSLTAVASDGSGYTININTGATCEVVARTGICVSNQSGATFGTVDGNGNYITVNGSGAFTDTLGQTALTVAGVAPNPTTFTYTSPKGTPAQFIMTYTPKTVRTNFGCSGVTEYGPITENLITSISLPDGTSYQFSYEATPGFPTDVTGRPASITLPTGGTINYTYPGGNNGIECADGSASGLSRQTPDGTWRYARSGANPAWTTTVTDPSPQANQTVLNFQGIYYYYETERQIFQGSSSSGTLLQTINTCYNGNTTNCNTTAVAQPITQKNVTVVLPGGLQTQHNYFYNAYGQMVKQDDYAYGNGVTGALQKHHTITFSSVGSKQAKQVDSVYDGQNNLVSQTTYNYDETPVQATTGTPQLSPEGAARGNVTSIKYMVKGSTTLKKSMTYYDTGNVYTSTDVNGSTKTYSYGSGSCGNSFPTSVSEPLSLSRSMTWNCNGGVQLSATDENGQISSHSYTTDPDFWRPESSTDPGLNVTQYVYSGENSVDASLTFNTSVADRLTTIDGLGRNHLSQRKQSPSSTQYDSIETDYDSLGRPSRTTLPYAAMAGTPNPSGPAVTTTYDALGRVAQVSQVTPSGTRSLAYTYSQNDVYRTLGPAPALENSKRRQYEYDSLGRLVSVCEVSTILPNTGPCGQTSPATGYLTRYTYDPLNHLTVVAQNAQVSGSTQTRSYTYDGLGRLTSETNAESSTTNYTYDSDSTCGTSNGDLVKKVDAVGNTTCYAYDALHRVISTTYSGPYASNTPSRYFVYDAATVNGAAMANAKTRMAEAYTCVSPCSTKITDLGFSYNALGQVADLYESSPHSGGYYHVTDSYYANGVVNKLSNLSGLPAITFGLDGEGRVYSASASSGQNPLVSAQYNNASLPTQLTFGSSDSDSYTFDPDTNRLSQYKFTVDGQFVVGALTWNAIGTLATLLVTDPFYSAGNQTCTYAHDDLSRVASANCGSPWSQTFTYDAFGNVSKTGTISFQPTYSYLTNQMTQIGSSTPTYDADGNVLTDITAHTYAWDANGRPWTIDGVALTYDALGRMVEQNKSGVWSEIVYSPTGSKLATMSGTTVQKAFVPLAGGSVAVYNSSGLAYYRHSDWVGSSRFASTPSRTMYFDGAYAPFGESYAQTGTTDLSFTGMNQDTVLNLLDFPAREYNPIHGRWPSPDPSGLSAVDQSDPQTFNRYGYVRNTPLSAIDPSGLFLFDCNIDDDDGAECFLGSSGGAGGQQGGGGYSGSSSNGAFTGANPSGSCIYLDAAGTGFNPAEGSTGGGVDPNSNQADCQSTGGVFAPSSNGAILGILYDNNSNQIIVYGMVMSSLGSPGDSSSVINNWGDLSATLAPQEPESSWGSFSPPITTQDCQDSAAALSAGFGLAGMYTEEVPWVGKSFNYLALGATLFGAGCGRYYF